MDEKTKRLLQRGKIPKWPTDRFGNPIAKTLSSGQYKPKVVPSGKGYRRIRKHEIKTDEEN